MLSNNFEQPAFWGTLKRGALLLIFILSGMAVHAQNFNSSRCNSSYGDRASILTQQQSYQSYQSVVYEPFDDTPPSAVGADASGQELDITNRRNGFIKPDNPNSSDESPVGEPWVLLFFAAVAAGVVYRRHIVSQKN